METHFLSELVNGVERAATPEPFYNRAGDCVVYQMANEATIAERIDDVLTIYHSAITNCPIGFQIKDVKAIVKRFGWDAILIQSSHSTDELKAISISGLLLAAYEHGPMTIGRRKAYAGLLQSQLGGTARIPRKELESFCGG